MSNTTTILKRKAMAAKITEAIVNSIQSVQPCPESEVKASIFNGKLRASDLSLRLSDVQFAYSVARDVAHSASAHVYDANIGPSTIIEWEEIGLAAVGFGR